MQIEKAIKDAIWAIDDCIKTGINSREAREYRYRPYVEQLIDALSEHAKSMEGKI